MSLTKLIPIPAVINPGVGPARQATMLQLLGSPRHTYDRECQAVTNVTLKPHMMTSSVGPFRVTGFDKAVASLTKVMSEISLTFTRVSALPACCARASSAAPRSR